MTDRPRPVGPRRPRHRRRPRDRPRHRRALPRGRAPTWSSAGGTSPTSCPASAADRCLRRRRRPRRPSGRRARDRRPSSASGRSTCSSTTPAARPPADAATASPQFSQAIIELNLLAPLVCSQRANAVMQGQADGGVDRQHRQRQRAAGDPGRRRLRRGQGRAAQPHRRPSPWSGRRRCGSNAVSAGLIRTEQSHLLLRRRGGHRPGRRHRAARPHGPARRRRRRLPLPRLAARRVRHRRQPRRARRRRTPRVCRTPPRPSDGSGSIRHEVRARAQDPSRSEERAEASSSAASPVPSIAAEARAKEQSG